MHRETTISREIKLLKNKFELLEKSRQFRSILQKSSSGNLTLSSDNQNELGDSLADSNELTQRRSSELASETNSLQPNGAAGRNNKGQGADKPAAKSVRIKLSKLHTIGQLMAPIFGNFKRTKKVRRRSNRVSSVAPVLTDSSTPFGAADDGSVVVHDQSPLTTTTTTTSTIEPTKTESNKKLANKKPVVRLLGRLFR